MAVSAAASDGNVETGSWLNIDTLPTLIFSLISLLIVLYAIWSVKSGRKFTIREIPGLKAVDEAVGRATEMGSSILYTPGWGGDIQRPTTIASMNILSSVATRTAEYDCRLIYPTHDPVIMAVAQEVVKESSIKAGHPERYRADDIFSDILQQHRRIWNIFCSRAILLYTWHTGFDGEQVLTRRARREAPCRQ